MGVCVFGYKRKKIANGSNAGTTFVNAYDIAIIPSDGIHYSVVLPYSFDGLKQDLLHEENPQVLKIEAARNA
jgi:hypothetical protein